MLTFLFKLLCQTPAEKCLVDQLIRVIKRRRRYSIIHHPRILNIGAGRSLSIEKQLTNAGCNYICDRIDVDDCEVIHPCVGKCWRCSVGSMSPVSSNKYIAAFANYALEHVQDLNKASHEIYRVLKPLGIFVASIPNPTAPEFLLAKWTPLWFHKMIRGGEAWKTYYSYNNIRELSEIFELAGFRTIKISYYSCIEAYLGRFPILRQFARLYDKIIPFLGIKRVMGNVCVIFEKPS